MILESARALVQLLKTAEPNTHLSPGSIVELAKLPAIVLIGPKLRRIPRRERDAAAITAIDAEEGKSVRELPPRWYDMIFGVTLSCKAAIDLLDLQEKLSRLNQASPTLTATNEERARVYTWRWETFPEFSGGASVSGVVGGRGELVICDVEVYSGVRSEVPLITSVEVALGASLLDEFGDGDTVSVESEGS